MILKPALPVFGPDQTKNAGGFFGYPHRFAKFVPFGYMYAQDGWTVESEFTKVNGKYYLAFFHANDAVPTVIDIQTGTSPMNDECLVDDGTYWLLIAGRLVKATYRDAGLHLADVVGLSPAISDLPDRSDYWFTLDADATKAMLYMARYVGPGTSYYSPYISILRKDIDLTGPVAETHIRNKASFDPTPPPGFSVDAGYTRLGYPNWETTFSYSLYPSDLTTPVHFILKCAGRPSYDLGTTLEFYNGFTMTGPELAATFGDWDHVDGGGYEFWVEADGVASNHVFICLTGGTNWHYNQKVVTPVYYTGTYRNITPLRIVSPGRMAVHEQRADLVDFSIQESLYEEGYDNPGVTSLASCRYLEVDVSDLVGNSIVISTDLPNRADTVYCDACGNYLAMTKYSGGKPLLYHKKGDNTWEELSFTVPLEYTAVWPESYQYGWTWLYRADGGNPALVFTVEKADGTDRIGYGGFFRLAVMTLPDCVVTIDPTTYRVQESYYGQVDGVYGYWPTEPAVYHDVGPLTGQHVAISRDGKHCWYEGIYRDNVMYANLDDYTTCRTVVLVRPSNAIWFVNSV